VLSKSTHDFTAQTPLNALDEGHKAGPQRAPQWRAGRFCWSVDASAPVVVMGIVNVTPDSFSDGGQHNSTLSAIAHAERLAADGAHILDIGGESTRPGAPEVSLQEELDRVLPVVTELSARGYCVSIDTRKTEMMREAVAAGAAIINDITALAAPGAVGLCADNNVGVVLMHMQGGPATMQAAPVYMDVVRQVGDFLRERAAVCATAGITHDRIVLDPGFGFGKTLEHNIALTQRLGELVALGYPLLAGWSRKRTLGTLTGRDPAAERVHASVAAALACVAKGARIVRVHDVAATVDALKIWRAFSQPSSGTNSGRT
jgi:dihydropteroate synthase